MALPDDHKGLKVVYDSQVFNKKQAKSKVDIVALHGIGAWSIKTWAQKISKDKYVNWLADDDMLQAKVPNSRIMIYGYRSDWNGENTIKTTARPIADRFLEKLLEARNNCPDRPLIFIAHCFGGIVLMKAMVQAPDLLQSTAAIFFFGVPFRGADGALGHGGIVKAKQAGSQGHTVQKDIMQVLRPNNIALSDTLSAFLKISHDGPPHTYCFYEQMPSNVWALANEEGPKEIIVPEGSGSLDYAESIPLERDHFTLNKFSGPDDEDYKIVLKRIVDEVNQAPEYVAKRRKYRTRRDALPPREEARQGIFGRVPTFPKRQSIPLPNPIITPAIIQTSIGTPFDASPWREEPFTHFESSNKARSFQLPSPKPGWRKLLSSGSFAAGLSLDCAHSFLMGDKHISIFSLPNDFVGEATLCADLAPPTGRKFHAAKIGVSIIAITTTEGCYVRRFDSPEIYQDEDGWNDVPHMPDEEHGRYECVAIYESHEDLYVAFGFERTLDLLLESRVKIYRVSPATWTSELIGNFTTSFEDKKGKIRSDPAKILNFSPDGRMLICSTKSHNQVFVWEIVKGPDGCNLKQICATERPFEAESDVQGITSVRCWVTKLGHPYMLCTTSPGASRGNHEGEWSFISPVADPFPGFEASAFHCLTQAQHKEYFSIHDGAVSNNGNAIALVSKTGKIGVIPIFPSPDGGIWSDVRKLPVKIAESVGRQDFIFAAAVRFTPDDSKLVAVDHHGKVVIAEFRQKNVVKRVASTPPTVSLPPGIGSPGKNWFK